MSKIPAAKMDTLVTVIIVFFVCLLSFSVGTYVGKRFSDYQHQIALLKGSPTEESLALNPETHDASIAHSTEEQDHSSPSAALSDDDVAKLAQEFATTSDEALHDTTSEKPTEIPTHSDEHQEEATHQAGNKDQHTNKDDRHLASETPTEPAPSKTVTAKASTTHTPATQTATTTTKAAHTSTAATANSKANVTEEKQSHDADHVDQQTVAKNLATSRAGKYTVQVGSFPTEIEASQLTETLKKQGLSAYFVAARVPSKNADEKEKYKTWYRVSVGLYGDLKEAESTKNQLVTDKKIKSGMVLKLTE